MRSAIGKRPSCSASRWPISIALEAHHLFDAATRPDLAALDDNLLVISSALLRNELSHFDGSPSTRARHDQRQQKLIHRLELLQARYEGNRLLY